MPAYNQTARIDVRGAWDFYVTGTFIYWQPRQENMELAIGTTAIPSNTTGFSGTVSDLDYDYRPGFQVALGMNFDHDNWDGYAQYTWLHGQDSSSIVSPAGGALLVLQEIPSYSISEGVGTGATSMSETWKFKFDFVDADLGRCYYVGKSLTFRPSVGARGAWIRQKLDVDTVNGELSLGTLRNEDFDQSSVSWGVGLRTGITSNWEFGSGFRMYGSGYGDILYTRYNLKLKDFVQTAAGVTVSTVTLKQHHADYLRPHVDLELGFGWGSYFDCNNWHIDLSASYGFQVFWNQNMFRHFEDDIALGTSTLPHGDLFIHGLTTTVRFDF
jgi:hypothetical protein